jgi:predicted  nucleic acid-binding Zn-ribbon protein
MSGSRHSGAESQDLGYPVRVPVSVRCERCGAVYPTDATPAAIREVNRCRECGGGPLTIVDEHEMAEAESDEDAAPPAA